MIAPRKVICRVETAPTARAGTVLAALGLEQDVPDHQGGGEHRQVHQPVDHRAGEGGVIGPGRVPEPQRHGEGRRRAGRRRGTPPAAAGREAPRRAAARGAASDRPGRPSITRGAATRLRIMCWPTRALNRETDRAQSGEIRAAAAIAQPADEGGAPPGRDDPARARRTGASADDVERQDRQQRSRSGPDRGSSAPTAPRAWAERRNRASPRTRNPTCPASPPALAGAPAGVTS